MSDWKDWSWPGFAAEWGGYGVGLGSFGRRFFGPGEMRLAVLSLLGDGPKHGYQIIKELEGRCGRAYRASAGVVYPTLQQLEDEGMVTSEQVEGRRIYKITDAGRLELQKEAETVRRIWRRAEGRHVWSGMGPEAASVAGVAGRLMAVACRAAARQSEYPEKIDKIQEILNHARRDIEEMDGGAAR